MSKAFTTQQKGQKYTVICVWEKTRNGFRHTAEVQNEHGYTLNYAKCSYLNRTWERYEFESVIHKVLDGLHLTNDKTENLKRIKALKRQIDLKALPAWAW